MTLSKFKHDIITNRLAKFKELVIEYGPKKGNIIETGAGMPLYTILADQPNMLSKIVNGGMSPTDWELTKQICQIPEGVRAVSYQTCYHMMKMVEPEYPFVFSDSIQIGNDHSTQTHGWIGYRFLGTSKYYHFTVNNYFGSYNRHELINIIQLICLDVLVSMNDETKLTSGYVDIILDGEFKELCPLDNMMTAHLSEAYGADVYQVHLANGQRARLNDLLRTVERELIVYKGSFDPPHPHHIKMYDTVKKSGAVVMMISVNNRESRKFVTTESLRKRIAVLNDLGIMVIVNRLGYFHNVITNISTHPDFKGKKLSFLCGDDTLVRFMKDEEASGVHRNPYKGVTFYTAIRNLLPGRMLESELYDIKYLEMAPDRISSTQLRELVAAGNTDAIREMYSTNEELYQSIKRHYIEDGN